MMKETLTPEQQRIAELCGTVDVLENILTTVLVTGIENETYSREQIEAQLASIRKQNQHEPENSWEKHNQSGAVATATRVGGMIGINRIFADAIKRGQAKT